MKCQLGKNCERPVAWIIEYLETGVVTVGCAEHTALCLVKETAAIDLTSIKCNGDYAKLLKEKLKEEPYPELVRKG
jgi:hypothetical protein